MSIQFNEYVLRFHFLEKKVYLYPQHIFMIIHTHNSLYYEKKSDKFAMWH